MLYANMSYDQYDEAFRIRDRRTTFRGEFQVVVFRYVRPHTWCVGGTNNVLGLLKAGQGSRVED
jgi:hypothetical protein